MPTITDNKTHYYSKLFNLNLFVVNLINPTNKKKKPTITFISSYLNFFTLNLKLKKKKLKKGGVTILPAFDSFSALKALLVLSILRIKIQLTWDVNQEP